MATLEHSPLLNAAPRQTWAVRVADSVSIFFRAWKNRREFVKLGEMSDAELADIGLVRADLHTAGGLDPTEHLNAVARSRTENAERAARRVC